MVGYFVLTDNFCQVISVFPPFLFALTKKPLSRSHMKTPCDAIIERAMHDGTFVCRSEMLLDFPADFVLNCYLEQSVNIDNNNTKEKMKKK